jgi:hypothetical protein
VADRTALGQQLAALFLLGWLLLSYPLVALFNGGVSVWGIPLLYIWLFGVWAALVAVMAYVIEKRS